MTDDPSYPEKVTEYLTAQGLRRLPWGATVPDGHVTMTKSFTERRARAELGEVAISLLEALGVSAKELEEIAALPWNCTPADMIAKLQEVRSREQPICPGC